MRTKIKKSRSLPISSQLGEYVSLANFLMGSPNVKYKLRHNPIMETIEKIAPMTIQKYLRVLVEHMIERQFQMSILI